MGTEIPRIGVFDSGVGGLTVLRACLSLLPEAEYLYLGDNGRAPYGNRSEEEICAFTAEALGLFQGLGVDAAVLACNTATAVCIDRMRRLFPFPVVGTEPAVRLAARECRSALVLATVRTAESTRLRELIRACPACSFTVLPCPQLAGEIEAFLSGGGESGNSVHFPPCGGERYDGVVLGCTHYVFFREEIAAFYGCKTFDGSLGVARRLLARENLGRIVHPVKRSTYQNQNICFEKKMKDLALKRVHFLGKFGNFNRSVFFSNICFNLF